MARIAGWMARGALLASVGLVVAACGSASGGTTQTAADQTQPASAPAASSAPAAASAPAASSAPAAQVDQVSLIGKVDADSGAPGTYTGKDEWPALAPSDIHVTAGATVTLTIKEYDDMVTALPDSSPYNKVMGGTETVDGKTVTSVSNAEIAHTITIPKLGINIPLPKAPKGGFTTVTFTFTAPASGSYLWECMTPCGSGSNGMGGAMQTKGWMRGNLIAA